jgi:hypothetical protein
VGAQFGDQRNHSGVDAGHQSVGQIGLVMSSEAEWLSQE